MKTAKPLPALHPELAVAVREALDRSPQPANVTKLRALLAAPYKVPPKLKDALVALLAVEVEAGRIHAWPGGKYWSRDARAWAEPVMLAAAAAAPVASTKLISAVAKQLGRPGAAALLDDLLDAGKLLRVPLFGGAKAKLCSRVTDAAVLRAELEAARRVIEAGYRMLGEPMPGASASAPPVISVDQQVLDAMAALEPRKGLLITAPRLYRTLSQFDKTDIDAALLRLQDARRVILDRHSNPHSRPPGELIADLYVGACWRAQE